MIHQKKYPLLLIALCFSLLFILFFSPRLNSDGAMYFEFAHSLLHDKDINFSNERAFFTPYFIPVFPSTPPGYKQSTGYEVNIFTIGPALVWLPAQYLLNFFYDFKSENCKVKANSCLYSLPRRYSAMFLSALAVFIGLLLIYKFLQIYFSESASLYTVLILLFTTQLPAFAFITPAFAHAFGFLFSTLLIFCWLKLFQPPDIKNKNFLWFILLGIAGGFLMLQRLQAVMFALIPISHWLSLFFSSETRKKELIKYYSNGYLLAGIITAVMFLPQLISQNAIFGNLTTDPQGQNGMHWFQLNIALVLFHKTRGLFTVNPSLFIGLISLPIISKKYPRLFIILSIGLIGQFYLNFVRRDWCGVGFGMRRFIELFPIFSFGFAAGIDYVRKFKLTKHLKIIGVFSLLLAGIWNFLLMGQYYFGEYGNPNKTLSMNLNELIINQFSLAPIYVKKLITTGFFFNYVLKPFHNNNYFVMLKGVITIFISLLLFIISIRLLYIIRHKKSLLYLFSLGVAGINVLFSLTIFYYTNNYKVIHQIRLTNFLDSAPHNTQLSSEKVSKTYHYEGELNSLIFSNSLWMYNSVKWHYKLDTFLSHGKPIIEKKKLNFLNTVEANFYPLNNIKKIELVFPQKMISSINKNKKFLKVQFLHQNTSIDSVLITPNNILIKKFCRYSFLSCKTKLHNKPLMTITKDVKLSPSPIIGLILTPINIKKFELYGVALS